MSDERLLRCPFCDGEAEIKWVPWTEISESSGAYVLNVNHSPHCFIRNADGLIDGRMTDSCKERIIKAWNTRKPMERIVEKLEKQIYLNGYEPVNLGWNKAILKAIEIVKRWWNG